MKVGGQWIIFGGLDLGHRLLLCNTWEQEDGSKGSPEIARMLSTHLLGPRGY